MIYKIRARLRPGTEAALLEKLTDGTVAGQRTLSIIAWASAKCARHSKADAAPPKATVKTAARTVRRMANLPVDTNLLRSTPA